MAEISKTTTSKTTVTTGKSSKPADEAMRERVEAKTLQPGEKQPSHLSSRERAQETLDKLNTLREDAAFDTMLSSSERAKKAGNPNPIPPQDRKPPLGPAQTAAADLASMQIASAEAAIVAHESSEAIILSDPRYERDQKILELGKAGKLNLVASAGDRETVQESVEAQVANDMARLEAIESTPSATVNAPPAVSAPSTPPAPSPQTSGTGTATGTGAVKPAGKPVT